MTKIKLFKNCSRKFSTKSHFQKYNKKLFHNSLLVTTTTSWVRKHIPFACNMTQVILDINENLLELQTITLGEAKV